LQKPPLDLGMISKEWTAFIDRDGVLNPEKENDYIRNLGEFRLYEGVAEAMRVISQKFKTIVLVSNQRGIGKKLMTEADLAAIHEYLLAELAKAGGRIDRIYYSTDVEDNKPDRKPNPGMAFRAAREIPGIDLDKALMIGNKPSDMKFGRNAGIYTIFLATTDPQVAFPHPDIDMRFDSLADFAKAL
jgi:histidinol-phosphate phosphatase family protein